MPGRDTHRNNGMAACCAMAFAFMVVSSAMAQRAVPAHQEYRDSFPESVRGFASMDWREKRKTLDTLIAQGKASLPALIAGLQTSQNLDKDARVSVVLREVGRHCAIALGEIGDASAVPVLIEALNHPDRDTRGAAIIALGKLGDKRAIEPLVSLWDNPREDGTNQAEAAKALVGFGKHAVPAIASARIRGRQKQVFATAALLKIALKDEEAVEAFAKEHPNTMGASRCRQAMHELGRRRDQTPNLPVVADIERKAHALERTSQYRAALELWEGVIDSGLHSLQEEDKARQAMLRIKQRAGTDLFKEPVATWKNKVFILARYDGNLPADKDGKSRHVRYSLSDKEIDIIRQRFALVEKAVTAGSCGALRMENDIIVVTEPWSAFRPTVRTGPLISDRYRNTPNPGRVQITRQDLNAKFHYKQQYLARGVDCVLFVMRSDPETFEMDGGAAAAEGSVLNASRTTYDDLDILAHCHEWLHILQFRVWDRGGFDWMQCIPLHDQLREAQVRRSWQTGQFTNQQEVFVEIMQKYMTTAMWRSIENREQPAHGDGETTHD